MAESERNCSLSSLGTRSFGLAKALGGWSKAGGNGIPVVPLALSRLGHYNLLSSHEIEVDNDLGLDAMFLS